MEAIHRLKIDVGKKGPNQPGEGFILTATNLGYPIKQVLIFGVIDVQSAR